MILLGVLSQYSWVDFITFILIVDGIVLAFGFALDKFVWSKDSALTKNEQRSQREDDTSVEKKDYKSLSEAACDYSEVKSIDDDFDEDEYVGMEQPYQEEYSPSTSYIAERLNVIDGEEDEDSSHAVQQMEDDEDDYTSISMQQIEEDEEVDNGREVEENNDQATEVFFYESEGCEIITSDDFDGYENANKEYLEDEEQKVIYANAYQDEVLTDITIKQGGDDEYEDPSGIVDENDIPEDLGLAVPKNLADEMDDPDDGPEFEDE